ncbi:MAG: CRTAC1 family protein, partial [Bacteroidota bacterium]
MGNSVSDKIYLNRGDWVFEDITTQAKIDNSESWTFGVSVVDVNADGLKDIYLTKVSALSQGLGNLLYVNKGLNDEGIPVFQEAAAEYGLGITGYGTHAYFFDQDADNDLDLFLLQHSIHPNRSYGKGSLREKYSSEFGDKFFENVDGKFEEVSGIGINQGRIGYGLDASLGDLDGDGHVDLYVGNDFFENDYLYINSGDNEFKEINFTNQEKLGHTTHFSMGNSLSDLNNDGLLDIVSLDMQPSDLIDYKMSGHEDPYNPYHFYLRNGYTPQFSQNTIHRNLGNMRFSEVAYFSGVAATDWSWNIQSYDYDLDGFKDIFITNGIPAATNDMDFVSFASDRMIQERIATQSFDKLQTIVDRLPDQSVKNRIFRNSGQFEFIDKSSSWMNTSGSYSAGAISADLDNDGDLDIVINNTNGSPTLLKNQANSGANGYTKVKLQGPVGNPDGLMASVTFYNAENQILYVNNPYSYLSSGPSQVLAGLGAWSKIDSIEVKWPDNTISTVYKPELNSELIISWKSALTAHINDIVPAQTFELPYEHMEEATFEFSREPLMLMSKGFEGPSLDVGDIDGDDLQDVLIGGGKRQSHGIL